MTVHIMQQIGLDKVVQINQSILSRFLGKIYKGYRREVQYHNDIHAADVLQMSYHIMLKGDMIRFASLSELDVLSVVVSAVCHDYEHDGLNNAYHVNAISERAIRYSD